MPTTPVVTSMLTFAVEDRGSVVRVALAGDVDALAAKEVRAVFAALEQASGVTLVEVDLSAVAFLDSVGIGLLIGAHHRLAAADRRLHVIDPSPVARRVLELTGVGAMLAPV